MFTIIFSVMIIADIAFLVFGIREIILNRRQIKKNEDEMSNKESVDKLVDDFKPPPRKY